MNKIMLSKVLQIAIFISSVFYSIISYAALTAVTSQNIKGTSPFFQVNGIPLNNTTELVGFHYTDPTSGNVVVIDATKSTQTAPANTVIIPDGVKENDIIAAVAFSNSSTVGTSLDSLIKTIGSGLEVIDKDGDSNVGAKGQINAVMKLNGNIIIPSNTPMTSCGTYTVEITVSPSGIPAAVAATTAYGDPMDSGSAYSGSTATYNLVSSGRGICIIQPSNTLVASSPAFTVGTVNYPATPGYTSFWNNNAAIAPGKGFIVSAMRAANVYFPYTVASGRKFSILGSGASQLDYECRLRTSLGSNLIMRTSVATVALGKNCEFMYSTSKLPSAGFTIDLYHLPTSSSIPIDTYVAGPPQKFARVVYTTLEHNTWSVIQGPWLAAQSCGMPALTTPAARTWAKLAEVSNDYVWPRQHLTNSRANVIATNDSWWGTRWDPLPSAQAMIRDIDPVNPTFLAEWGGAWYDDSLIVNANNSLPAGNNSTIVTYDLREDGCSWGGTNIHGATCTSNNYPVYIGVSNQIGSVIKNINTQMYRIVFCRN